MFRDRYVVEAVGETLQRVGERGTAERLAMAGDGAGRREGRRAPGPERRADVQSGVK